MVILEVYDIAHFIELIIDQKNLFPAAEQRITPWQDDAAVSKCPLCMYVFLSSLHLRNHHRSYMTISSTFLQRVLSPTYEP